MDDDKLSTIIKETEANLIRLKQQYRNRELPPQITHHKYAGGSWNMPSIDMETSANRGSALVLGFLNQIKEKLDEQSQTLHKVNSTVQKLEAENSLYKQELMNAHSNVVQLSTLLDNERRKSHSSLERHLIQMQEMMQTELKRMSQEINYLKLKLNQQNYITHPESTNAHATSNGFRQNKKTSQNALNSLTLYDTYEDALKVHSKSKQRPTTVATTNSQYPLSSLSIQQATRLRGCKSAPEPQIRSVVNSLQKLSHLDRPHKKIHRDNITRTNASSSRMSTISSERDLHSSSSRTISSSQNLTLQSDEEDLHSDDSNFDLLSSSRIGKFADDLDSGSNEDLMSDCESCCSEKLS